MHIPMNMSCRRLLLVTLGAVVLAGCTSHETKEAIEKAKALADQKNYQDANAVLIEALRAREAKIRAGQTPPTDQAAADADTLKVQSDREILKMEREQVPLYLHLERADLASAVYSDIRTGNPNDKVIDNYLDDPDPIMRTGAVRVLGLAAKPESIDELAKATKDSDKDVRRAAVAALGSIHDPKTVPPLIDALKDSYWFVRSDAADALGREHDMSAIDPLLGVVSDTDSTVESSSENALLMLCTLPGAPAEKFAAHLNDSNPRVATISAIALAVLRDKRAVPSLLKLATSPDVQTRLHAVKALGETGDPSVIPTLRETLKDPEVNVRGWSIIGLGKLKDQDSVTALRDITENTAENPNIRRAANAAVNHITGENAPDPTTESP
jgi:HEAT repeat protein